MNFSCINTLMMQKKLRPERRNVILFKTKGFLTLTLLAIFSLIVSACGGSNETKSTSNSSNEGTGEAEYILTYSDHDPPGGLRTGFVEEVWIPEIEKQTGNRVKVESTYGAGILGFDEALQGVKDGIVDMSVTYPGFHYSELFGFQLYELFPKGPDNWEGVSDVFHKSLEEIPLLQQNLEDQNQKALLSLGGLPFAFAANYEMESLSDLEGKKWRVAGPWNLQKLDYIGAEVINIPLDDVYSSLQNGTVNGQMTNFDNIAQRKFHEVGPNVIVAPNLWYPNPFIETINLDTWNGLPEDIQEGILKASEIAREKYAEVFENAFEKTVETIKSDGAKVIIAEEDDIKPFLEDELSKNLKDQWLKDAEQEGVENPEEAIKKMEEIIKNASKGN